VRIHAARLATPTRPSHPQTQRPWRSRVRPSSRARMARTRKGDLPDGTRGFFATRELTAPIGLNRRPKLVFPRTLFEAGAPGFASRRRGVAIRQASAGQSAIHGAGEAVRIAA